MPLRADLGSHDHWHTVALSSLPSGFPGKRPKAMCSEVCHGRFFPYNPMVKVLGLQTSRKASTSFYLQTLVLVSKMKSHVAAGFSQSDFGSVLVYFPSCVFDPPCFLKVFFCFPFFPLGL